MNSVVLNPEPLISVSGVPFIQGGGLLRTVDSSCCLRDFRIYNTTLAAVPGVCRETLEVGYSQAAGLGAPFTFSFADILSVL